MTGGYKFFSALPYIGSWDLMFQQQQPATGLSRGLEQGECEATRCCPPAPDPRPGHSASLSDPRTHPPSCHADVLVYRLRTGPELHQQGPCEARLGYQDESHQLGPGTQICHMVLAAPVPAAPVH